MILFQDHSLMITLQEDSNVLTIRWLEVESFNLQEFELEFHLIMQKIEQYNIKKVLVHPCKALINLPNEDYKSIMALLQSGFVHTRVEKVARIFVDKSPRDLECIAYFKKLLNEMELEIAFENFEDNEAALAWLAKPQKFRPAPILKTS